MNARERSIYNRMYYRRTKKKHRKAMKKWLVKKLSENPNYYREQRERRKAAKMELVTVA